LYGLFGTGEIGEREVAKREVEERDQIVSFGLSRNREEREKKRGPHYFFVSFLTCEETKEKCALFFLFSIFALVPITPNLTKQ
jgi:hypothetical protein